MLYVRRSPLASDAVGRNEYAVPTRAVVAGLPLIVGALFVVPPEVPDETARVNDGSAADVTPSEAMIMMDANVPVAVGVPESLPVEVLKVAHDGLLRIEKISALPSGSFAVGWNE